MKVEVQPSPNFNDRKHPIDMLVLHYTGMETGQAALDRMCDPDAQVSAHYMLWEDGRVVQLVGEDKRAWHAGVSSWQGDEDLNSRSIGIEIVNGGHDWPLAGGVLPPYPDEQIDALIELCQGILVRCDIPMTRIVGHSDIAPPRKEDPGEHFPWDHLARSGIGLWPFSTSDQATDPVEQRLGPGDTGKSVADMQSRLLEIGYGTPAHGDFDAATEASVRAFQRRWVSDRVSGAADLVTLQRIELVRDSYRRIRNET